MGTKLLIFGGSGHAKDVIHIAKTVGYEQFEIVTTNGSCEVNGYTAVKESAFDPSNYEGWDFFAAIGNNSHRQRFLEQYSALNFVNIISPTAEISESVDIGRGCYIGAFAYIGPDTTLADGSIINTHSILGHDSQLGAYSQIGPRVCVSGHVEIGKSVFIGAGALFNNGSPAEPIIIPDHVNIGMGCHVTASVKHEGLQLIPKPNHIGVKPE
ncbi:MAG: hypothetical protein ACPGES_09455 [Coraliomargarita sp.]